MRNLVEIRLLKLKLMRRITSAKSREDEILKQHAPDLPFTLYKELASLYKEIQSMEIHMRDIKDLI
jgi:hypothetical protein